MSVFKVVTYNEDNMAHLQNRLTYIRRPTATRMSYVFGVGVSEFDPFFYMAMVKENYHQTEGKTHFHYILNFGEEDVPMPNIWHIGREVTAFLANFCGHFQVVSAVHFDCDYLHMHFIANNIDYETGERFDLTRARLSEMKSGISDILRHYDVSEIRQAPYVFANDEGCEEELSG